MDIDTTNIRSNPYSVSNINSSNNSNTTSALICPVCHMSARPTDYFCSNCGRNLRPAPLSTAPTVQTMLYVKSLLLPPMGIIWGLKYLRQPDKKSKMVGIFSIVLTIVLLLFMVKWTINLVDTVNEAVNSSMNGLYGY